MKQRTAAAKINETLTADMLTAAKAEIYYKASCRTDVIDIDSFFESFKFLCGSGCFMDRVGRHYERDFKTGDCIIETGRMDGSSDLIITAYL